MAIDADAASHVLVIAQPNDGHVVVHCRALEVYRCAGRRHAAYAQYSRTWIFMRLQWVRRDRLQAEGISANLSVTLRRLIAHGNGYGLVRRWWWPECKLNLGLHRWHSLSSIWWFTRSRRRCFARLWIPIQPLTPITSLPDCNCRIFPAAYFSAATQANSLFSVSGSSRVELW